MNLANDSDQSVGWSSLSLNSLRERRVAMGNGNPVVQVKDLVVEYVQGRTVTRALDGISFEIREGECVGFVGANGAGKSTTIKTLMGFIFPTSGEVCVFGQPAGSVESRRRIGYLPEVALYYPFMKARELLELYGGLHGLTRQQLKQRIPELLRELGLDGKGEVLLRNFSKGMQQRLGIAQAIISDPDLMIFDELSSGLDPVGRYDLRKVLLKLKERGKTIFFSSHELTEVESLCDRVIIIHKGRIVTEATVQELLKPLNIFEISFAWNGSTPLPEAVARHSPTREGDVWRVLIRDVNEYAQAVTALANSGAKILATASKSQSLEDYFISLVQGAPTREQGGQVA
ncbi:MAG: ABC transporter ATP-binding protein [Candidatus Hydrogenedentota bacterium]|nr:MAG: ABC transporter ATP-binding protein [Candidatus Hydrogenedentota bacterium]